MLALVVAALSIAGAAAEPSSSAVSSAVSSSAAAVSSSSAVSSSAVAVLPLLADGTVSVKQAHGVTAMLRAAVAPDVAKLLADTRDDDADAQKCQRDAKCFAKVGDVRGADFVVGGLVTPVADGLRASIIVVRVSDAAVFRKGEATIQGNDGDDARVDRLMRTVLNPSSLQGTLVVTGDEGAAVELDGKVLGTLPLDVDTFTLVEGDHRVVVRKPGYSDYSTLATITHRQTSTVKAVLLAGSATPSTAPSTTTAAPSHLDAYVVGGVGVALLLGGAFVGAWSYKDTLDVEARAKAQQLAFPKDSALYQEGQVTAYVADGLYAGAVVAGGAAVALWVLE